MSKRVLVPIANGFEEIEAVTVIDILRRAGAEVVVAGLGEGSATGRSEIVLTPDCTLDAALGAGTYDMIVLPGGLDGTYALRDDHRVIDALREVADGDGYTAAICAAPLVLDRANLLADARFTSHPATKEEFSSPKYDDASRVVTDNKLITSRSPGTAMEFALELVERLFGSHKVEEVNAGVLAKR